MSRNNFRWPQGQKCAVSLTYDDGLPVHCDYVGPALVEAGLRATFFVPGRSEFLLQHPERWRELAGAGHELGNHSLFHPCRREPGMHDWLEPCYDLCDYTPTRLHQELAIANLVLRLVDGRRERTYGNTCCDTTIGRGDGEVAMDDVLRRLFVAARGPGVSRIADVRTGVNLMQVGHYGADSCDMALEDVQAEIARAAEMGGWIVFMIHGVGAGTHDLYMERAAHEALVAWLASKRAEMWTAPFIEVAKHVKRYQNGVVR